MDGVVQLRPDGGAARPRTRSRRIGEMAQATTIFDAADQPAFTIFKEQRIEVPIERVSPNLIKAVISVEDQRFYEHSGVDAIRIAAAVVRNVRGRTPRGRGQHHHAAARPAELSHAGTRPIAAN